MSGCYFFAGSVVEDDEDDEPVPVVLDAAPLPVVPLPVVPVPVVPVELVPLDVVPGVEPALLLVPPPLVPAALPEVVSGLLPVVPEDDDETGGGEGGVTTVVDDVDEPGVALEPVVGGVSWRCWQAESASRTLAATAVMIGRFIVAPVL